MKIKTFQVCSIKSLEKKGIFWYKSTSTAALRREAWILKAKWLQFPFPFMQAVILHLGMLMWRTNPRLVYIHNRDVQTHGSEHATSAGIRLSWYRSTSPLGRYLWDIFISMQNSPTVFLGSVWSLSCLPPLRCDVGCSCPEASWAR